MIQVLPVLCVLLWFLVSDQWGKRKRGRCLWEAAELIQNLLKHTAYYNVKKFKYFDKYLSITMQVNF